MMRNAVKYEWDVETLDENEDIIDHDYSDNLKGVFAGDYQQLVLVRSEGNEIDGVTDRLWAYVKDSTLPEYFENDREQPTGYKVPVQYHKELKNYLKLPQ